MFAHGDTVSESLASWRSAALRHATVASVLLVAVMMIIAGVAKVINAFQVRRGASFCCVLFWGRLHRRPFPDI